eukprot:Em0001g871a
MEICASTEAEWESGNVDTGGSSTVTESHSPSAIASDELSLAIGDEDIGHLDEAEKDSESSSDSDVANILSLTNSSANKEGQYHPFGLSNLTFVSHTLRCMFPALPSVSTMVSYRLPGYRAPEKELAEMFSHPLKTRSIMCGSLPVFMVPLIIFSDDTSGNRSKVWNKFDSWCFLLAGLRQKDNAQFCNIHFICTSNQVPVMEMTHPLVDQLLELERGIVVFDAQLNTNALILAPVICFLCDNPRAAEICSHLGSGTLRFCRICRVDHTNSLTGICEERKRSSTIQEVQLIRSAHTQAERKRLRTLYGTSEKENHLLQLPVDLHQ